MLRMQQKRPRCSASANGLSRVSVCASPCAPPDLTNHASRLSDSIHDAEAVRARMLDPYSHMTRDRESNRDAYSNFVVPGPCRMAACAHLAHLFFRKRPRAFCFPQLLQQRRASRWLLLAASSPSKPIWNYGRGRRRIEQRGIPHGIE
jgi:hypothetical protein